MMPPFVRALVWHLADGTIFASLALAAAYLLRRASAHFRYAALLAAALKFAVPVAFLAPVGSLLAGWLRVPRAAPGWIADLGPVARSGPASLPSGAAAGYGALWWALAVLWLAGAALGLAITVRRLRRPAPVPRRDPNPAERAALVRALGRLGVRGRVDLLIGSATEGPGTSGPLRPYICLPDSFSAALASAEFETVLLHEAAHVRRRDSLASAAVAVLRSLFWFHPLLWWIEARLSIERERACDEKVLAAGVAPADYASAIWKSCRFSLSGVPPRLAAGARSHFSERLEQIMSSRPYSRFSRAGLIALATAAVLPALAAGFVAGQSIERRAGVEFVSARVLKAPGSTADHAVTLGALRRLLNPYAEAPSPAILPQFPEGLRRIDFANKHFKHGAVPGAETDRGRLYLVLGPPDEIEFHPTTGVAQWLYHRLDGSADQLEVTFRLPPR